MSENISREELVELRKLANERLEQKKKQKRLWQRRNAKLMLFKEKAVEAGIEVTDEEIDEYLNK